METTLIQSKSYVINLSNVAYFRASHDHPGTEFKMTNSRTIFIKCPYDKVVKQLGKRMATHHLIKLDY